MTKSALLLLLLLSTVGWSREWTETSDTPCFEGRLTWNTAALEAAGGSSFQLRYVNEDDGTILWYREEGEAYSVRSIPTTIGQCGFGKWSYELRFGRWNPETRSISEWSPWIQIKVVEIRQSLRPNAPIQLKILEL